VFGGDIDAGGGPGYICRSYEGNKEKNKSSLSKFINKHTSS
jgi:hypothetical protein